MKVVGIIPCRYGSSRLPGKPLADICGRPMMWHVYQRATQATALDAVFIASADEQILQAADNLGLKWWRTSGQHATGSDCVAECIAKVDAEVYVNVQGDEPMIEPESINRVATAVLGANGAQVFVANAYAPIRDASEALDHNVVKAVIAYDGTALAFSRQPIPYPKQRSVTYLRQLGLYAFRRLGLEMFASHRPGHNESIEGIEMLRMLEYGHKILMVEVGGNSMPVDTASDLARVREIMAGRSGQSTTRDIALAFSVPPHLLDTR